MEKKIKKPIKKGTLNAPWVNIRTSPGGDIKEQLPKGTELKIVDKTEGWVLTEKGYVREDLIDAEL